jgi:hypothetical protein
MSLSRCPERDLSLQETLGHVPSSHRILFARSSVGLELACARRVGPDLAASGHDDS